MDRPLLSLTSSARGARPRHLLRRHRENLPRPTRRVTSQLAPLAPPESPAPVTLSELLVDRTIAGSIAEPVIESTIEPTH